MLTVAAARGLVETHAAVLECADTFMLTRWLKFFGSLTLAVVLLSALAVILAVATFYESNVSTKAAALNIYRSWWFNGLLALLAINVASAALRRWPWKRKHVGFVITHAGIIVLLGGCSAAFHYGTEGMMDLRVGHPPTSIVRLDDEAITVVAPELDQPVKQPIRVRKSGAIEPRRMRLSNNLFVTLDEFLPNSRLERVVEGGGGRPNPAVQFRLQSELAQQDVSDWLLAASPDANRIGIGPANVEFIQAHDEQELKRFMAPPDEQAAAKPMLEIAVGGKIFRFDIADNLDKHLDIGDTGVGMHIMGYWPDFRMDENHKPKSASDQPNNPAAVVILSRGDDEQRAFVFADPRMPPIVRTTRGQPIDADVRLTTGVLRTGSVLQVVLGPAQKLYYAAHSKDGFKSGELEMGKPVETGWMDLTFAVEKFVPDAVVSERVEQAPADPDGGFPAVRVTAHDGATTESEWVRFGQPIVLHIGSATLHVMFGWDTMQVPFTVRLEQFEVQRDEGSMNVAGWISHVVFEDPERGITQKASVWMNHPAWFGGYKFSQASWNPNDLQYTALQVKKDPRFVTWLTWTGAALIVSGIMLMFYFRRWLQRKDEGGRMKDEEQKRKVMVTA